MKDSLRKIWKECRNEAGLTSKEFFSYFKNSKNAYAIKIGKIRRLRNPVDLKDLNKTAPQSFYYLNHETLKM